MPNPDQDERPVPASPSPAPAHKARSVPPRRPFRVTLLIWLVLSLSAWGLLRFAGALRWWDLLHESNARLGPAYLSVTGAVWALTGIVILWSLFSRRRWSYMLIPILVLVWLAEYWIERIFFEAQRSNLPFAIVASLLVLAVSCIIAFHRSTKNYLTKSEEHEQPEEYSASS